MTAFPKRSIRAGALLAAFLMAAPYALAEEACGICVKEIVTTPELAACFLDNYDAFAAQEGSNVAVDLNVCGEESRGGLEALPSPTQTGTAAVPDVEFMIARSQLDCLKKKLEEPGLVLDPSARIELATCG